MKTNETKAGVHADYIDRDLSKTSVFNLMEFNFKFLTRNISTVLLIVTFLLCAITIPVIFIPMRNAFGGSLLLYLILPELIILGHIGYDIKVSTLYYNIETTGIRKRYFYLSSLFTIIIIGMFLSAVFWSIMWIISMKGLMFGRFAGTASHVSYNILAYGQIINIIYITIVASLVSYSFYFLLHSLANSIKVYYIFVILALVLGIIFGGSLNTYFDRACSIVDVKGIEHDAFNLNTTPTSQDQVYIINESTFSLDLVEQGFHKTGYALGGGLFPEYMFVPTLFYPFYGIGQFTGTVIGENAFANFYRNYEVYVLPETVYNMVDSGNVSELMTGGAYAGLFDTYPLFPDAIDWKQPYSLRFNQIDWYWSAVVIQPWATAIAYFFIGKSILISKEIW